MPLDAKFLANLPKDEDQALAIICEKFYGLKGDSQKFQDATELLALASVIKNYELPQLSGKQGDDITTIENFFLMIDNELQVRKINKQLQENKKRYEELLKRFPYYEFTEPDFKTIQEKIDLLRSLVSENNYIDEEHKKRLLKRVEKLERKLHKRTSDFDAFWGLMGDTSIAIRLFGERIKPIIKAVEEILEIVWRTQTSMEQVSFKAPKKFIIYAKAKNGNARKPRNKLK